MPKFISPGVDGMPDRIVFLPDGCIGFIKVKAPGKVPRPLQDARHRILGSMLLKITKLLPYPFFDNCAPIILITWNILFKDVTQHHFKHEAILDIKVFKGN